MGMLEVTCVPAIMEETLIREYTVNLPTSITIAWVSSSWVLGLILNSFKFEDREDYCHDGLTK